MGAVRLGIADIDILVPNDDLSSVEVALPFTFLGVITSCWVNNNGSISFDGPEQTFTPGYFDLDVDGLMEGIGACLAPLWCDVDTRSEPELDDGWVKYGATSINGRAAFIATWHNVGYYDNQYDLFNTFQVVMYADGFEFNYDQVQWDLGRVSNDSPPKDAYYWRPARAGFFIPQRQHYIDLGHPLPARADVENLSLRTGVSVSDIGVFELPGSGQTPILTDRYGTVWPGAAVGPLRDGEANSLISGRRNSDVPGRYYFSSVGSRAVPTRVGELGCGEYRVLITDRCGGRTICDLTDMISVVSYSRIMDDTSEAQVVLNASSDGGDDLGCCACLGDTRTWLHSMVVYRNGELVWGPGPIYNLLYRKNTVTVTARDVSAWLDVRVVHNEYTKALGTSFVQQPIDLIVRTILTDALSGGPDTPDDPCGLVGYLDIGPIPALMDKEASIGDGYAGDIFRDLARNVLDYTVVGNRIIVRKQLSFGPYGRLTDEDFQTELEVEERGAEAGTKWYVNGNGVFGSCGGEPEHIQYLGLIEQVDAEDQIIDLAAVKAAACSRLQGSNPAPLYVNVPDGAKLSPSAGVTMNQLIPGTLVDVSLRDICRAVTVRQRLTALHVTVTNGDESIGVTLSPIGTGFGEAGGSVSRPLVR